MEDKYLCEEWRDGCFVDSNRKKLWSVELDIIKEIDKICEKHAIKYCVLGGALIGIKDLFRGMMIWISVC